MGLLSVFAPRLFLKNFHDPLDEAHLFEVLLNANTHPALLVTGTSKIESCFAFGFFLLSLVDSDD
ncbi:hypothetical protein IUJ34_27095 (plasmid) [Klebsiella pneumoniae subsp. pneumoniae]|uniref:Uncharacterized protein n=1 Tax=Klebsiella pneumoniae subsp. pneumoniae TaxID=72407 RepID=A0A7S9E236_KLEPN|nr:hypothetical protein IUJ34_27095 [Klebsiella pneumoniae subsp. pneumoniae]